MSTIKKGMEENCHKLPLYQTYPGDIQMLFALLALFEGNPPATGGFPSQRASDADL